MYFVEADISEAKMRYKRTKLLAILEDFKKTGMECARIVDHDYKKLRKCQRRIHKIHSKIRDQWRSSVCQIRRNLPCES